MAPRTPKPQQPDDPNAPDIGFDEKIVLPGGDKEPSDGYAAFYQQKYEEAWIALRSMDRKTRLQTLEVLRRKGFGSPAEVTADGTDATDIDKYASALVAAFVAGRPAKDFINKDLNKLFPDVQTGGITRKTPTLDVDRVFEEVSRIQLGRSPRPEEREKFRNAYAAMEAGGNAPTVASAAEQQVMEQNPGEAQATQFAGFMDKFQQMLRGA